MGKSLYYFCLGVFVSSDLGSRRYQCLWGIEKRLGAPVTHDFDFCRTGREQILIGALVVECQLSRSRKDYVKYDLDYDTHRSVLEELTGHTDTGSTTPSLTGTETSTTFGELNFDKERERKGGRLTQTGCP